MAFPSLADITESIKGMVSGDDSDSTDATTEAVKTAVEAATGEPAAPTTTTTTAQEPETPPASTSTEPLSATVAKTVNEKGVAAFLAELPDDVKEKLGPELNKSWYRKLSERDQRIETLNAQVASIPSTVQSIVQRVVAEQFDAIRMEGMSPEDRKAFEDKRDLEALRSQKAKQAEPELLSPTQMRDVFAKTPLAGAFWETVDEVGLPRDPANAEVAAFFNDVLREFPNTTSAEHGVQVIKSFANKYRKQAPAAAKPDDLEALITKKATEIAQRMFDEKLKSTLRPDSGRPGASAGVTSQPKNYDQARREAAEMLRAAER